MLIIKANILREAQKRKNWTNLLANMLREAQNRKDWTNLLEVKDLKGSQIDLGGKSCIKANTR